MVDGPDRAPDPTRPAASRRGRRGRSGGPGRYLAGLHAFLGCGLAMVAAGGVAAATGQTWLFPSLGPTAMLQIERPGSEHSTPRNTVVGHLVALLAGEGSLLVFGLRGAGPALAVGVDAPRVGAAALSLAVTAAALRILWMPHPPAGATTLIVSLGLLPKLVDLAVVLVSVCLVTAACWGYNRLRGTPMPVWSPVWSPSGAGRGSGAAGGDDVR